MSYSNLEIIRRHRPLLDMKTKTVKTVLKTGIEMMIADESDEQITVDIVSTARKLISDATLELAYRN